MRNILIILKLGVFMLLIAFLCGCTKTPTSKAVKFINPIIENVVREQLSKSETEQITADELLTIKSFYYYDADGEDFDLRDFLMMPNIELLAIEKVSIKNEDTLSSLHQMITLSLDKCNLNRLPSLEEIPQLETLGISYSHIVDIGALKDVRELKSFDATGFNLNDFSVLKGMEKLELIYAARTAVKDISALKSVPNLKVLDLRWTSVEDILPLLELEKLEELNLYKSEIAYRFADGDIEATAQIDELREALPNCKIFLGITE
ncbi:MAG: hypothetical protein FWH26_04475 [Oscillospiraceae bacterium]|nr:hypothetical protein [Oscillospiraceae bacterium]